MLRSISRKYRETALIKLIAVGLIIGILIALYAPAAIPLVAVLGDVFVRALKGVAPILVFVLVMNAMAQRTVGSGSALKPIVRLYVIATFLASIVAVAFSFAFPSSLHLVVAEASVTPPSGIVEVVHNLILNVVDNPLHAIANANYIGILAWSILAGVALQKANATTKNTVRDFAVVMTQIVLWVIRFAPFGIMGLVADAVGTNGKWELVNPTQHEWIFTLNGGMRLANRWGKLVYHYGDHTETHWYHFGQHGIMDFGWYRDEAMNWYYLDRNHDGFFGRMKTGWHLDDFDQRWYYFDESSGVMQTGWQELGGKWYYFAPTASAETYEYDAVSERWYYKDNATVRPYGSMYRNEVTPDGYRVDATGAWIPGAR